MALYAFSSAVSKGHDPANNKIIFVAARMGCGSVKSILTLHHTVAAKEFARSEMAWRVTAVLFDMTMTPSEGVCCFRDYNHKMGRCNFYLCLQL